MTKPLLADNRTFIVKNYKTNYKITLEVSLIFTLLFFIIFFLIENKATLFESKEIGYEKFRFSVIKIEQDKQHIVVSTQPKPSNHIEIKRRPIEEDTILTTDSNEKIESLCSNSYHGIDIPWTYFNFVMGQNVKSSSKTVVVSYKIGLDGRVNNHIVLKMEKRDSSKVNSIILQEYIALARTNNAKNDSSEFWINRVYYLSSSADYKSFSLKEK